LLGSLHPIKIRRKRCMSSTCSQGSGISPLALAELEGSQPWHSAKSTEPATQCSTSTSLTSPYSPTSSRCDPTSSNSTPTSFAEDSLVRTSHSPARAKDSLETVQVSGTSTCASSTKPAPSGRSSKTSQPFAIEDWTKSCGGSLRSGITLDGIVFPQAPLVPLTKETVFGLLPTVRASEYKGCGPKGSRSHNHWSSHFYLSALVTDSGKLNPTFAEAFMGMPLDWTDV